MSIAFDYSSKSEHNIDEALKTGVQRNRGAAARQELVSNIIDQ
jgi:hypothetical protein